MNPTPIATCNITASLILLTGRIPQSDHYFVIFTNTFAPVDLINNIPKACKMFMINHT